jgi:endonuclease/exonuclease/phosphatase family metal-dependent hydrolase
MACAVRESVAARAPSSCIKRGRNVRNLHRCSLNEPEELKHMKIVTWNAQGAAQKWGEIYQQLASADFDVLLIQEVTSPPEDAEFIREHCDYALYKYSVQIDDYQGYFRDWYIIYFRWMQSNPGNARCSLAMLLRHYEPTDDEIYIVAGDRRPLLCVQPGQGQPLIGTLHATSGYNGQSDARDLLQGLNNYANGRPWVAAGDFNTPPSKMRSPYWIVCPPQGPTQISGSALDYAIRSQNLGGSPSCGYYQQDYLYISDHWPQEFTIVAAALQPRALVG